MAGLRPEGDEDMLSNRRSPDNGQPLPPRMRFILIHLPEGDSLLCSSLDLLPIESPVGNYPIEDSRIIRKYDGVAGDHNSVHCSGFCVPFSALICPHSTGEELWRGRFSPHGLIRKQIWVKAAM